MVTSVVVPLDGSPKAEEALGVARALADGFEVPVGLLQVADQGDVTRSQQYLDGVAATMGTGAVTTQVRTGPVVDAITTALGEPADAIGCMTTRGHTGLGAALLGSVAEEVLKTTRTPIVMVGPNGSSAPPPTRGGIMVLCFDGSDAAASLAPLTSSWAQALGLRVRLVTVLHRDGEFIGNTDATETRDRARSLAARLDAGPVEARLELLDGLDPARTIADYSANEGAALIATAPHGRGLSRAVLGSVATRVVRHSPCPVLLRPPLP
jgi:nucleotide-binding universal stress UspA family protein